MRFNNLLARAVNMQVMIHTNLQLHCGIWLLDYASIMYIIVHWALICEWAVNWYAKWEHGCVRTLYLILNSNGTNVRCFAGTFCREVTGHIYWHAALHSCSSSSYCVNLSSLTVRTHTTCICFGGEVDLFVKTVCVNRRTLITL